MPNTGRPLPIPCPKCGHQESVLTVRSITIMTVKCDHCGHQWATDIASLPASVLAKVHAALRNL